MHVFSEYFWHLESWTPRNEALMEAAVKQARTTRHQWLIACDASMSPRDVEKSMWFQSKHMFIKAPAEEVSTCRSRGPQDELTERTYDHVFASRRLRGKVTKMEVV